MTAATVSRWARRFVLASVVFLLGWQAGAVLGVPRRAEVTVAVYGFVLPMVFGKAYSLVPTYFDRELAVPRAPAVQFPLVVLGAGGLVGASLGLGPDWVGAVGAVSWGLGVSVFLGAILWTVRGNLTGRDTATGGPNAHREPVDRLANRFVPVALGYLAAGSYETVAMHTALTPLLGGSPPRVTHLLAAGTAALLVFALGFRLLPRFTTARPPRPLVAVVLPAGAVGPALLATHLGTGLWFQVGALLEAVAMVGFAATVGVLVVRSSRRRVGFYGVLAGAASGVVAVGLGVWFAVAHASPALVAAHLHLNLLGFLGLTIVGVAYQFYPPAVGALPGASDRAALGSIGGLTTGLGLQVVGLVTGVALVTTVGSALSLGGALLYAYLLVAVFAAQ
jgi:hypothetical protein